MGFAVDTRDVQKVKWQRVLKIEKRVYWNGMYERLLTLRNLRWGRHIFERWGLVFVHLRRTSSTPPSRETIFDGFLDELVYQSFFTRKRFTTQLEAKRGCVYSWVKKAVSTVAALSYLFTVNRNISKFNFQRGRSWRLVFWNRKAILSVDFMPPRDRPYMLQRTARRRKISLKLRKNIINERGGNAGVSFFRDNARLFHIVRLIQDPLGSFGWDNVIHPSQLSRPGHRWMAIFFE